MTKASIELITAWIALLGAVPTLAAAASLTTNFSQKQAYWMDRSHMVIPAVDYTSGNTYSIIISPTGGIVLNSAKTGLTGGAESTIPLEPGGTLTAAELARYPQLSAYTVFTVPSAVPLATLESALTGQMVFSSVNAAGTLTYATACNTGPCLTTSIITPAAWAW